MKQAILRSARIAELHARADEVAALCRPAATVELPRSGNDRRRLLMLLARERRRSKRLVDELTREE